MRCGITQLSNTSATAAGLAKLDETPSASYAALPRLMACAIRISAATRARTRGG